MDDFEKVLAGLRTMHSIDTLAKSYYVKYGSQSTEYKTIKKVISIYLIWEQLIGRGNYAEREKRFSQLIAYYIDPTSRKIPANVRFLSWNYDSQLQLAMKEFLPNDSTLHKLISEDLISYPQSHFNDIDEDAIQAVHLNGFASCGYNKEKEISFPDISNLSSIDVSRVMKKTLDTFFPNEEENFCETVRFAWDFDNENAFGAKSVRIAKNIAAKTNTLIIIGYSFPAYNREVDREIINEMQTSGNLKKIIFCDPNLTEEILRQELSIDQDISIEKHKNLNQFPLI